MDIKKVVRSRFLHFSLPLVFTFWRSSWDQIFTLFLSHHLNRNPINFGKVWGAPAIAKTGKGKQPLPGSLLSQAETEPRSSHSKSFAVTGVLGSRSTAEPKRKGAWGHLEDCSSSETHGRILSSDCGGLTLAGCPVPPKMLYHSLPQTNKGEKL